MIDRGCVIVAPWANKPFSTDERRRRWIVTRRFGAVFLFLSMVVSGAATADAQSGNTYYGTLWAGQYTNSATYALRVTADCSELMVRFFPENGWEITEYHVDIVSDPAFFPLNPPGNPRIGHFQWSASFPPTTQNKTFYVLPDEVVDPVACGQLIYVAIHAVMVQRDSSGNIIWEETAWGGPCGTTPPPWDPYSDLPDGFFEFPGNRWGFYLSFLWEGAPTPTPTPVPPTPTPTPVPPTPTPTPVPPTPTPTPVPPTPTPVPPTPTPTPIPPTPTPTPL